jgi:hypothetical protein
MLLGFGTYISKLSAAIQERVEAGLILPSVIPGLNPNLSAFGGRKKK